LPFGGYAAHKGYGLSLVCEILSGILNGAGCGFSDEYKGGNGIFFEAMDIQSFTPLDEFKERMDRLLRAMRASKRAPGSTEILVPGDPEARMEEKRLAKGVPIPEATWEEFTALADRLGLNIDEVVA
jgi:LDH2 family malate/lactate/ureidoglycolate dehydrogenase